MPFFEKFFKKMLTITNGCCIIKTNRGIISANSCKEGDMY